MEAFVTLNVGGLLYTTTRATLTRFPSSMLGSIFKYAGPVAISKDDHGRIFIDRDGTLFRHILNYLRKGYLVLPENFSELDMLADEATFYELPKLVDLIHERKIRQSQKEKSSSDDTGPAMKPGPLLKNGEAVVATERELLIVKLLYENYADMATYDKFLVLKRNKTIHAVSGHLTGRVDTFREIPNAKFNEQVRDQFSDASSAFIASLPLSPAYATEHQLFQDLTKIGFQLDGFSSELRRDRREDEQAFFSYKTILFTRQRSTGIQQ